MTMNLTIQFGVPAEVIYKAMLDEFDMSKTTRTKAFIEAKEGGQFKLYEGRISGEFVKLETNKLIAQTWKMNDWEKHSEVEIKFEDFPEDQECELTIEQKGLPGNIKGEYMKQGWMSQIFRPMSLVCGYPIINDN